MNPLAGLNLRSLCSDMLRSAVMNRPPSQVNYQNLLKRYAAYASNYDRRWARYSAATLSKAVDAIPSDGQASLLDVACGTGLLAEMLRREHPQLSITGVDISPQMLDRARQRVPPTPSNHIAWHQGHAEQLPVENEHFDIVTCTNAFHLVQDTPRALESFRNALKPGGTLIIVDWCRDYPFMRVRDKALRLLDRQRRQIRTLDELVNAIETAGFAIQSRERFRTGMWGMMCVVALKPEIPSVDPMPTSTPAKAKRHLTRR
jgi:SAM-dependent methyltransferase